MKCLMSGLLQVEKDKLIMRIESARNGKSWDEIDSTSDQVCTDICNFSDMIATF